MRRREDPKGRNSAWIGATFMALAFIGWQFPVHTDPPPTRDCTPVTSTDYPAARQTLIGQGYTERADGALLPRGCER